MAVAKPPQQGAQMSRREFHRRYARRSDCKRLELIEGAVQLPPRIPMDHASAVGLVYVWLEAYAPRRGPIRAFAAATLLLDDRNEPLPDALLIRPEAGWLSADGFVAKVPELVVEVASPLTVHLDLNEKLRAYERNGVKEYIVWRTLDDAIDWFELVDGSFVARFAGPDGRIESAEFRGLVLDVVAALAGDEEKMLAALHR